MAPQTTSPTASTTILRRIFSLRGAVAIAVLYVVLRATVWRPSLEQQAAQCFAAVQTAIAERDPGDILDRVSIDYPFAELWPQFSDQFTVRNDPEADPRYQLRQQVGARLGQLFFILKDESPRFTFELQELRGGDATPLTATVRLMHVGGRMSRDLRLNRGPVTVDFILERRGWLFPSVVIAGHDRW